MLRGKLKLKLKLPDRTRRIFPDRLGGLIARFDGGGGRIGGSDSKFEHREELETFRPNGFGRDREIGGGDCEESGLEVPSRSEEEEEEEETIAPVKVSEVVSGIEKRSEVECELSENEINLKRLRGIAGLGLPDGGVRATTWKLLLGYLPPSRDLWEMELTVNRLKYEKLKEEILCSPSISVKTKKDGNSFEQSGESGVNGDGQFKRHEISHEDHPLSSCKASYWQLRSEYTEIAEQIDRDLQRTHPDMKFFSGESSFSKKNREAMRSILLLFAKLNPAIRYVQGMNEVLAPIYYVFSNDTNEKNAANAEADSFSCFVLLLSDSVDHFCQQLDNSSVGILSTLSRLSELLKAKDEELWWHLQYTTKVEPQFYAFRWITLLLTQEFNFQLILRIWDSILSNPFGVQDVLLRICCAMLLCMKSRLISGDFVDNMKLLQHYPEINIEHLLQVARELSPYMAMASQGLSSL